MKRASTKTMRPEFDMLTRTTDTHSRVCMHIRVKQWDISEMQRSVWLTTPH